MTAQSEASLRPVRHLRRFGAFERVLHGFLMLSFLGLAATGLPLVFSDERWASNLARLFGGFAVAGTLHRLFATIMIGVFLLHVGTLLRRIVAGQDYTVLWGPTSMVPQPRDLSEMLQHFLWFVGRAPRPQFDRYTYWEKFDYWAVFWGMAIIGGSGLLLAFPAATASVLPGWIFNVATIVHGEEAVLAAVFLFTVHFFNNHFRPDKFPLDIVMFTGAVSLDEFRREHALEYERLKSSGELDKHLVDAPSRPMTIGSAFLGFSLIVIGLTLLMLVLRGFATRM